MAQFTQGKFPEASPYNNPDDGPQEINVIQWMDSDPDHEDNIFDFRPTALPSDVEVESAPKASSVPESAPSSETEGTEGPESPAPVVKDSGAPKDAAPSTPSSSVKTSDGKPTPPAVK